MAETEVLPEADAVEGYTHPRMTEMLFGHAAALSQILKSRHVGRLHHAIMLAGPKGIGKATLAWRVARLLLDPQQEEVDEVDIDWQSPTNRRVSALSEPRMLLARRGWDEKTKKLRNQITVDDMRDFKSFFNFAATDGGWRVAIIDAADELNVSAANAMLKILEEPPERTTMFLIAHHPSRLLPTIRSRCLTLPLATLTAAEMEAALRQQGVTIKPGMEGLSAMAGGSVGQALRLIEVGGLEIYASILDVFSSTSAERGEAIKLADACLGPANRLRYEMTTELIALFLARLAKRGAAPSGSLLELVPGEARVLNALSGSVNKARQWAELAITLPTKAAHGWAVNLDPSSVVLDMLLSIEKAARQ
ncbi:MAG: DNA polymerase III subunit delta' [Pseudomonadota bacterium]